MDFFQAFGDQISESFGVLTGRAGGPFKLRLILQPLVATILAVRAGLMDSRKGYTPYLWSIFRSDAIDRRKLVNSGWNDIRNVFFIALGLEVVYEIVVSRWVYPIQAIMVAILLAIIPYFIFRGLTTRIASSRRKPDGV
jgi:hypothetical protein